MDHKEDELEMILNQNQVEQTKSKGILQDLKELEKQKKEGFVYYKLFPALHRHWHAFSPPVSLRFRPRIRGGVGEVVPH